MQNLILYDSQSKSTLPRIVSKKNTLSIETKDNNNNNNNNNNNSGLLTVYPPGDSLPVKSYNIKNEKLQYTTEKKKDEVYNIKSNNIGLLKDIV